MTTQPHPSSLETPAGTVVVGIDGSTSADQALQWAAQTAALEHRPLTVVHCAHLTSVGGGLWSGTGADLVGLQETLEEDGRALLANALRRAAHHAPDVVAHGVLSTRDPREELLSRAEHASLVVVGSRGRGAVGSLLLGSVSVAVAEHADCPVVVVRHEKATPRRHGVLVGSDGDDDSRPAVELAYRTASLRGLPLTVMHTFWDGASPVGDQPVTGDGDLGLSDQRARLARTMGDLREKFPDVADRLTTVRGSRDSELLLGSHDMDLVVVSRRPAGLRHALGSPRDARTVVEHSACDVVVVPPGPDPAP